MPRRKRQPPIRRFRALNRDSAASFFSISLVTFVVVLRNCNLAFGIANHIAALDDGRIIAIGTSDQIKSSSDPRVHDLLNASISEMQALNSRSPRQRPP